MSEEEIIKTVDNFLDGYRQYNVETGETYIPYKYGEGQKFCYVKDFEAIQGLLDLYNKEKEKNKELFEEYNKRVATIIKYEQEIKEIIDKIDAEDYYCLNEAEEDLRKLVE